MSIDRFATTRIGRVPRAVWGLLGCGAALAGVMAWRHGAHRCSHHGARAEAPIHELHVELAAAHEVGELHASVALYSGREAIVMPLFEHPEPALSRWYDVYVQ